MGVMVMFVVMMIVVVPASARVIMWLGSRLP
jgi:hypothetical protein